MNEEVNTVISQEKNYGGKKKRSHEFLVTAQHKAELNAQGGDHRLQVALLVSGSCQANPRCQL